MNRRKIIYFLCLFFCIGYGISIFMFPHMIYSYGSKVISDKYLTLWDNGTEGIFFLTVTLLCMFACVLEKYKEYYFHFDKNCILRIGLKKYIFNNVLQIFVSSLIFMLILHISLFVFALIYFANTEMVEYVQYNYYSDNQILNVMIFILLSSIGTSIFNIFMYSLSIYISNLYVYIVLPIIVIFVAFICVDVLVQSLQRFFDPLIILALAFSISPSSLIEPGSLHYPLISFILSSLFYISISISNFVRTYNLKKVSD